MGSAWIPIVRLLVVVSGLCLFACQDSASERSHDASSVIELGDLVDESVIPLDQVKPSQRGSVSQTIANTELIITYDRPVARGRELFGGIVPYGEIWNPGANNATTITVSRRVTINGNPLAAGKYSIWAIPRPSEWTLIFSRAAEVFHEPYPGEQHDELRIQINPIVGHYIETLAFYFPAVEKKDAELWLHWGNTILPFAVAVP